MQFLQMKQSVTYAEVGKVAAQELLQDLQNFSVDELSGLKAVFGERYGEMLVVYLVNELILSGVLGIDGRAVVTVLKRISFAQAGWIVL